MRFLKLMSLIAVLSTLVGCSSYFRLSIPNSENPEIKKIYNSGYEEAVSEKNGVVIAVAGEKQTDGYLRLWIYCKNNNSFPVNLITENISITGYSKSKSNAKKIYVYPAHKFLKKIRDTHNFNMTMYAISAGLQAYNAGHQTSTTTSTASGSAYDSYGNSVHASAYGTSTTKTYNPQAEAAVNAQNQQLLNQQAAQYDSIYNAVENGILKNVTLYAGQGISGNVMADYSMGYSNKYEVVIPVENDNHSIVFVPESN